MSEKTDKPQDAAAMGARNVRVAVFCATLAFAMVGAAYAAVPLYDLFCRVTGYGGTTQRANAPSDRVLDRIMTVRFDANVAPKLAGWKFEPVQHTMDVKVGENSLAFFRATNTSDKPLTGTAAFNVAPDTMGLYFSKIECFCFTEQTLQPGQTVDMPVSFFIDPKMVEDRDTAGLSNLTLSYVFYPANKTADVETDKPKPNGNRG